MVWLVWCVVWLLICCVCLLLVFRFGLLASLWVVIGVGFGLSWVCCLVGCSLVWWVNVFVDFEFCICLGVNDCFAWGFGLLVVRFCLVDLVLVVVLLFLVYVLLWWFLFFALLFGLGCLWFGFSDWFVGWWFMLWVVTGCCICFASSLLFLCFGFVCVVLLICFVCDFFGGLYLWLICWLGLICLSFWLLCFSSLLLCWCLGWLLFACWLFWCLIVLVFIWLLRVNVLE